MRNELLWFMKENEQSKSSSSSQHHNKTTNFLEIMATENGIVEEEKHDEDAVANSLLHAMANAFLRSNARNDGYMRIVLPHDEFDKFSNENLKPTFSPASLENCAEDEKAELAKFDKLRRGELLASE